MAKINELVKGLKSNLLSTLTSESPKSEIDRVNGIVKELDSIEEEANVIINEKNEITGLYVNAIKGAGSATPPDDATGAPQPKSLEECIADAQKASK